jgi:hypothetical protein
MSCILRGSARNWMNSGSSFLRTIKHLSGREFSDSVAQSTFCSAIGSDALGQAVRSDRDRNGPGATRAGHKEADVAFAVVIRAPPTLTRPHPNGSIEFHERGKRGVTRPHQPGRLV